MKSIILIGMPGSGKTTLGKVLASKLELSFIDFDDDVIEIQTGKSVSQNLAELGEEKFVDMENRLGKKLIVSNNILGTSGSLPYCSEAMRHLKKQGITLYLKVPITEIETRFKQMKTDRIIGMKHKSFQEIFAEREHLYEKYADIVFSYSESNIEDISTQLLTILGKSSFEVPTP